MEVFNFFSLTLNIFTNKISNLLLPLWVKGLRVRGRESWHTSDKVNLIKTDQTKNRSGTIKHCLDIQFKRCKINKKAR